jgi:MFS transporter, SP family, solute carrier family 2 (myo-inositol transporter), member 13
VAAALIGDVFQRPRRCGGQTGRPRRLFAFKDKAWRGIFWVSLPPGILFVMGSFMVAESPRWLFRRGEGCRPAALAALAFSDEQALMELQEMEAPWPRRKGEGNASPAGKVKESLLQPQICDPVRAGLRHSGVQPGHGHQFNHRLQHDHSPPSRLERQTGAFGSLAFNGVNFLATIGAVAAGGPQRPQVPARARQRRRHRFAALRRHGFQIRKRRAWT